MIIISTAKMGPGTLPAKYIPLSMVKEVEGIIILRKEKGPKIKKVRYIVLPKVCKNFFANGIITPLYLIYYSIKLNADFILAYHFIPHGFFAYIASVITRKPYVIGQTGLYIQKFAKKPFYGSLINYIMRKAYYLNVPGTQSKRFWENMGVNPEKINILHSTIDTDYYVADHKKKKYDFIFLGRLAPEKQIDHIIEAFHILHREGHTPTIVIVGSGGEKVFLERLVSEKGLGDYVDFVGFQKDVRQWLNLASIFVMSSKSEGLPTSLMQAMSCEMICISSDVGNTSDIVKHGKTGFLFQSSDILKLSELMRDTYLHQHNYEAIRMLARKEIVANHSFDSAVSKWSSILNKL